MITITHSVDLPNTYPLERIGNLNEIVFFDIETTGFSAEYSTVYLIGCTYYKNDTWNLIQWFADNLETEIDLLNNFFNFISKYSILIHFNGDGFDIPYLLKRCSHFNLDYDFSNIKSIDIYKKVKTCKKLLGLDRLKQKSIENFLGINREDTYSGGELISIYKDYLISHDEYLYHLLLLHNEDDLKGMPLILPILNYVDLSSAAIQPECFSLKSIRNAKGEQELYLEISCNSSISIPVAFDYPDQYLFVNVTNNQITLSIAMEQGSFKHYYPDYQNYYYLLYEDYAVHKSVGEFVDKSARKKATKQTCYTKKDGLFLPQFKALGKPDFKKEYKDAVTYLEYSEELFKEKNMLKNYVESIWNYIFTKK